VLLVETLQTKYRLLTHHLKHLVPHSCKSTFLFTTEIGSTSFDSTLNVSKRKEIGLVVLLTNRTYLASAGFLESSTCSHSIPFNDVSSINPSIIVASIMDKSLIRSEEHTSELQSRFD